MRTYISSKKVRYFSLGFLLCLFTITISSTSAFAAKIISMSEAIAKAQPQSANGKLVEYEIDTEDKMLVHSVKFFNTKTKTLATVEVNAVTGQIVSKSQKQKASKRFNAIDELIPFDKAVSTALKDVKGDVIEVEIKQHNNAPIYQVSIVDDLGWTHEVLLDATSGKNILTKKNNISTELATLTKAQAEEKVSNATNGGIIAYSKLTIEKNNLCYEVIGAVDSGKAVKVIINAITGEIVHKK